jgi:excisionase family DNA binding protein
MMASDKSSLTTLPFFLNVSNACEVLGISQSSLLRHVKDSTLPHIKLGRRILIPREAIDSLTKNAFKNSTVEYPEKAVKNDKSE